ncbi:MAG: hypothetical protein HMLKMBBP_03493 [Planctomycetes bacterium]|nr:hypothetical protein [Planctomycetota bacterium]
MRESRRGRARAFAVAMPIAFLVSACISPPCTVEWMDEPRAAFLRRLSLRHPEFPGYAMRPRTADSDLKIDLADIPNRGVRCDRKRVLVERELLLTHVLGELDGVLRIEGMSTAELAASYVNRSLCPGVFPAAGWETAILSVIQRRSEAERAEFREAVLMDPESREARALATGRAIEFEFVAAVMPGALKLECSWEIVSTKDLEAEVTLRVTNQGDCAVAIDRNNSDDYGRDGCVWVEARDESGVSQRRRLRMYEDDENANRLSSGDRKITLVPGSSLDLTVRLQDYLFGLAPGVYTATFSFSGGRMAIDHPLAPEFVPVLASNRSRLRILAGGDVGRGLGRGGGNEH